MFLRSTFFLSTALAAGAGVSFNQDIRPILSNNCIRCHGPDEAERKGGPKGSGGLRLDVAEGFSMDLGEGRKSVVPGKPEASELLARVTSHDADELMPPGKSGKRLKESEVKLLTDWIREGATVSKHWSYEKPLRPVVPGDGHPVDAFIRERLEREGLKPQPEADRATLMRRVALDLTGLPPSPEEVEAFLKDAAPGAYERLVDGLLASPAYGEHQARQWLDLARYADSAGYADDPSRTIWGYRDYVIRAFNRNLPFDQFTIEQIAGDLLPGATDEQLVATAFHRNTMTNSEGGTNDEEFRSAAVVDRVNTTAAVWMGSSMACAQCHTHKYDPITHHEYFAMYAFLNNTADADRRDESPLHSWYGAEARAAREKLAGEMAGEEAKINAPGPAVVAAAESWARAFSPAIAWDPLLPVEVAQVFAMPAGDRSGQQVKELSAYYIRELAPELDGARARLAASKKSHAAIAKDSVPMLRELPEKQRRTTQVQLRGNWQALGDKVTEGVPAAWHPLPPDAPRNRLTLARWLVSAENPLTARVIVNRYWETLFGTGIVRTSEEFGSQGELPSHPELLDWLAVEFMEQKWDVKAFLKLLVTSAAYRQSSRMEPGMVERDPENRLLARGPRLRLSGEMVRDQALAVSGLLSRKMHGPPVRPQRPNMGLSAAFGGGLDWQTSGGEDRFRRALYTEWRRTSPYPSMTTFDAPNREVCTLRRNRTNTPLQALVTLNDPVFVEAAQALARRVSAPAAAPEEVIRRAMMLTVSRPPAATETQRIKQLFEDCLAEYRADARKAAEMATNPIGPVPAGADAATLAAWSTVANVLLNLDEALMKR